ncbi:MAG TPA: hypothetical protein P5079_06525 [Elusimicrobiota bacterium]|nr:hypothetical protein [Elusimicrobiota bacterium]
MADKKNILNRLPALWAGRFRALGRLAEERGLTLCLVGGCVRDLMLAVPPLDWDAVVQGPAGGLVQESARLFKAEVVQHPSFLTYTLLFADGTALDVATARSETYPHPAALPVVEPSSLAEDFARRDFTVNAMAVHLSPGRWGRLEDPFDGRKDLRRGLVRVLHAKSFMDDPTRLFRAARYAGRNGWTLDGATLRLFLEAIKQDGPALLSRARRRTELERLLGEHEPRPALKMLWKSGLWGYWNKDWRWSPFYAKWLSAASSSGLAPAERVLFRLMVLCRFRGAEEARRDLMALEFPRNTVESVTHAVHLREAIAGEKFASLVSSPKTAAAVKAFLRASLRRPAALRRWERSVPLLGGEDLRELGFRPGPVYQKIFESLRRARWEGRVRNRADEVRHVIDNFSRNQ